MTFEDNDFLEFSDEDRDENVRKRHSLGRPASNSIFSKSDTLVAVLVFVLGCLRKIKKLNYITYTKPSLNLRHLWGLHFVSLVLMPLQFEILII